MFVNKLTPLKFQPDSIDIETKNLRRSIECKTQNISKTIEYSEIYSPRSFSSSPTFNPQKRNKTVFTKSLNRDKNVGEAGCSPLHSAVYKKDLELCKKLVNEGADVNAVDHEGCTPLHYAVMFEDDNIGNFLIARGANDIQVCHAGLSAYMNLKIRLSDKKSKTYQKMSSLPFSKKAIDYAKEFFTRKLIGHAFELEGTTSIRLAGVNQSIELTGGFKAIFWKKMAKNILFFRQKFSHLISSQVAEKISLVCKQTQKEFEEKIAIWEAGMPVIFNAGYKGHHISALVWKNQMIICDRGGDSKKVYRAFKFSITKEFLKKLQQKTDTPAQFNNLINPLPKDDSLERALKLLDVPFQKVGNCAWANTEGIILPLLILSSCQINDPHLKDLDDDKLYEVSREQQVVFENWRSFHKLAIIQKYIQLIQDKDSTFPQDIELVAKAILDDYEAPQKNLHHQIETIWKQTRIKFLNLITRKNHTKDLSDETAQKIAEMRRRLIV